MSDTEERPSKKPRLSAPEATSPIPSDAPDCIKPQDEESDHDPSENGDEKHDPADKPGIQKTGMSKSQMKKLRKKAEWDAGKEDRKIKRREKLKEKKARKATERAELAAKIAAGEVVIKAAVAEEKAKRPSRPVQTPVSLILDCAFNELMTEKEIISLAAQITRSYSDNRCTPFRSHLAISSWGGVLQSRFEMVLNNNHLGWKGVNFFPDDFESAAKVLDQVMRTKEGGKLVGAFAAAAPAEHPPSKETQASAPITDASKENGTLSEKQNVETGNPDEAVVTEPISNSPETMNKPTTQAPSTESPSKAATSDSIPTPKVIYLSSDSPHTLDTLSPYTSYIIGGIVDKNRHKGICYKRAIERGIPTAKLPIGEYMTMQSRSVLAVNHVVEIMLKWLETGDWGEAFLSVIPKRKEARLKRKGGYQNGDVGDEDGKQHGEEDGDQDGEESEYEDVGGTSLPESHAGEETAQDT